MTFWQGVSAAAAATLLAAPAWGDEFPFLQAPTSSSFQSTAVLESHDDRDAFDGNTPNRGMDGLGRLDLRLTSEEWVFAAVATGYGRLTRRDDSVRRDVVDLEEAYLGGPITHDLRVRAGDLKPRFGRGLVLDFASCCERSAPPLTLRGGRVDLDTGPAVLTALGGIVHLPPLDPATELVLEPRHDAIGGARVEMRAGRNASVSLHYAAATLEPPQGVSSAGAQLAGLAAELNPSGSGGFGLYVEGVYETLTVDARPQPGTALYVAADYSVGPLTVLAEAKDYNRFDFGSLASTFEPPDGAIPPAGGWPAAPIVRYNAPPTLERKGELLPVDTNTIGGRLTTTLRLSREVSLEAAYTRQFFFHARGDEPRAGPGGYFGRGISHQHLWGELRTTLQSGADFSVAGGSANSIDVESNTPHALSRHAEVRADVPISAGWSVAASGEWRNRLYIGNEASLGAVGLSVRSPQGYSVGGRYESSDEFKDWDGNDNVVPRRHFISVEGRARLGRHEVFGLIGSTAGGLRCLDGACRVVPPFHGFRVGATLRF